MCGIVGYNKNSIPLLLNGLERLVRGYDSSGIVDKNDVLKRSGKVESLKSLVNDSNLKGTD